MEHCKKCYMNYSNTDELKEGHCCDCKMNYITFRKKADYKDKEEYNKNYILEQDHCCKCKVNVIISDQESVSGYIGHNPNSNTQKHCCNCGIVYRSNLYHCCRCKKEYYYKYIYCCDCGDEYGEDELFFNLENAKK